MQKELKATLTVKQLFEIFEEGVNYGRRNAGFIIPTKQEKVEEFEDKISLIVGREKWKELKNEYVSQWLPKQKMTDNS